MKSILLLMLSSLLILTLLSPATAGQTDNCHCFRDRSYDPGHKFAADDYLLTTSFNSLIAATLSVKKRQIVLMKMKGGVDPDELLIALYIADKTEAPVDALLSIRDNGGSWQDILNSPSLQQTAGTDPVFAKIAAGTIAHDLTSPITDAMINTHYHAQPEQISTLRSEDFSNKELNLIFALNKQTTTPVKEIVGMARQKKMSWSEIAHHFNLTPAGVGKTILGNQT
ncbi:MAG: hypothetical protein BA866_04340 [Desulfobulbaceae bacterium S5133MH15]|nr:MAG: hypothetical protein BA866_04340 [Desulfobulbaceae bacterium S5133MH15]